jgi:hypothetical protein
MCTETSVTLLTDADGHHLCGDYGLKKSEERTFSNAQNVTF